MELTVTPIQGYLGQHITADAQLPALFLKPLRIACTLVSEMEIIAADQMPRLELTVQIFLNEHIPGHMHHGLVKMRQDDVRNTKAAVQDFLPILD